MKKLRILTALIVSTMLFLSAAMNASADFGSKPYINVIFTNTGGERYYSTFLAPSTAPWESHAVTEKDLGTEWFAGLNEEEQDAMRSFVEYPAPEGYSPFRYLLSDSSEPSLRWSYMPPDEFIVVVYFPESGRTIGSDICHTYAFGSIFTADLSGQEINVDSRQNIVVEPSYQVGTWLLEFAARALITIAVELVVALIFGYWEKRTLLFFTIVNLATQILLNIILSLANINYGFLIFLFAYLIGEIAVVTFEAVLYGNIIGKYSRHSGTVRAVFYAICANLASLFAGVMFTVYFAFLIG